MAAGRARVIEPVELGAQQASDIALLARVASEFDPLHVGEVRRCIFDDPDPQVVVGVYDGGLDAVGAGVVRGERGYLKYLAVHPRARRAGIGSTLLERIESFCREQGATTISTGNCAPFYVTPGIDVRSTELLCLLADRGYRRSGDAVNQSLRLVDLPDPPLPVGPATESAYLAVRGWLADEHPNWLAEYDRAFDLGTLITHDDDGFACYDVNRDGWFGPMATRGGPAGKGVGASTLLGCLHAMRRRGYERADIAWVGPVRFYAKVVGARINRVFWWYRKSLD